jgi:serine/threonine protein kinase
MLIIIVSSLEVQKNYDFSMDIFAIGNLMHQILFGHLPFKKTEAPYENFEMSEKITPEGSICGFQ